MKDLLTSLLAFTLKRIPLGLFVRLIRKVVEQRVVRENPRDVLKALLEIDNFIYTQVSQFASDVDGSGHAKHRLTGYIEHFASLAASQPGPYLDVGCGKGALADCLARKVSDNVVGIDILYDRIEEAKQYGSRENLEFVAGDAVTVDLGKKFSTIIMSNVLEHIEERPNFLVSLQKKYKPETFLIRVPNFERDWRVPLKKEMGIEWRSDITHCTEHTESSLSAELRSAGLEIVEKQIRWGEIWVVARSASV